MSHTHTHTHVCYATYGIKPYIILLCSALPDCIFEFQDAKYYYAAQHITHIQGVAEVLTMLVHFTC